MALDTSLAPEVTSEGKMTSKGQVQTTTPPTPVTTVVKTTEPPQPSTAGATSTPKPEPTMVHPTEGTTKPEELTTGATTMADVTTMAPTPSTPYPAPATGNWNVTDPTSKKWCIKASLGAQFSFNYTKNDNKVSLWCQCHECHSVTIYLLYNRKISRNWYIGNSHA